MKHAGHYENYVSEFEIFLNELKQQRPEIDQQQREGRLLLWELGPLKLEEVRRAAASEVKLKPYVYD